MPLLTSQLVLAGTLLISPQHPARVRAQSSEVWFSDATLVKAQTAGPDLILSAQEGQGRVYAFGLDRTAEEATRILVVHPQDYEALLRCPNAPVDPEQSPLKLKQGLDPLQTLPGLESCKFRELTLNSSPTPELEKVLMHQEAALLESGFRILGQEWSGGRRHLRLSGSMQRARQILGPWAPLYHLEHRDPPKPGRTLVFLVTLFEFSRNRARSLGIGWPTSIPLLSLEGNPFKSGSPLSQLGLDFGESLGLGRVLAQPSLRTKPGEKAFFHSGGELPIRTVAKHVVQTQWKNYGLLLELTPSADVETGASEIALGFRMELSEPDASTAIDGVPGMITRKLESRFDLRVDQTTVLTTMVQTRLGAQRQGLPGVSQLPLLQRLFSRRTDSEQSSELWFAIRPSWEEMPAPEAPDDKGAHAFSTL